MRSPQSLILACTVGIAMSTALMAPTAAAQGPERSASARVVAPATAGVCPASSAPTSLGGTNYQIDDSAQLQGLRDDTTLWDDSFVLGADIDRDACLWGLTIGDDTTAFTGSFNGAGFSVSNINISRSS